MSRTQRARRLRQALARALLQGHGRREADLDLRHGAEEHREADDRDGARQGRRQPDRSPPRCSASTATRCARRCSSCGSKGEWSKVTPGAAQRLRQVRDRRAGPRAGRARASSSSPPAARRSCSQKEGVAVTEVSALHRLPGDARRAREDAASEDPRRPARAARRSGAPRGDARRPASRRSTCWWSTSIRSRRRSPTPTAASRTRSRTSTSAARRCCARRRRTTPASRWWSIRPTTRRVLDEIASAAAAVADATRFDAGAQGVRAHRGLRRRDRQLPLVARRRTQAPRVPDVLTPAVRASCRTCATARTRTRARRSTATTSRSPGGLAALPPAAGQGALLQQHRRRRRGVGVREELRRAGLRHRQARQPLRRRRSASLAAAYDEGVQDRPDLGLRRHPRLQPRARRAAAAEAIGEAVRRGDHRAALRSRRAARVLAKKANLRVLEVPLAHDAQAHDYKRVGGGLLVQSTDVATLTEGPQGRDEEAADRGAAAPTCCFAWTRGASS